MHISEKCNSGRAAIQWFHIKHYLDYQYTKFQPYTFRVQKMCVFARYATLVPRLETYTRINVGHIDLHCTNAVFKACAISSNRLQQALSSCDIYSYERCSY